MVLASLVSEVIYSCLRQPKKSQPQLMLKSVDLHGSSTSIVDCSMSNDALCQ